MFQSNVDKFMAERMPFLKNAGFILDFTDVAVDLCPWSIFLSKERMHISDGNVQQCKELGRYSTSPETD